MRLKWFRGRQLPEVMRQVRNDLGDDAVILRTRTATRGLRGLMGMRSVEVLAAVDDGEPAGGALAPLPVEPAGPTDAAEPFEPAGPLEPVAVGAPLPSTARAAEHPRRTRVGATGRAAGPAPSRATGMAPAPLGAEVAELRDLIIRLGGARVLPPMLSSWYTRLLARGLDEETAFRVLDELGQAAVSDAPSAAEIEWLVGERLMELLRAAGSPAAPSVGVIALVGPPGAGKTAMAAKLAVRAQIATGRARLVSLDAMSLGAAGHLDALGAASGVTCALAASMEQLGTVMRRRWPAVTVIDTPGVSARDADAIAELAERLRAAAPTEVHLVVPATCKSEDALASVAALAPLGLTHLAFTRLDEATTAGSLVTVGAASGLPLSYVADGREIPHDLHTATARGLVRLVLKGDAHP